MQIKCKCCQCTGNFSSPFTLTKRSRMQSKLLNSRFIQTWQFKSINERFIFFYGDLSVCIIIFTHIFAFQNNKNGNTIYNCSLYNRSSHWLVYDRIFSLPNWAVDIIQPVNVDYTLNNNSFEVFFSFTRITSSKKKDLYLFFFCGNSIRQVYLFISFTYQFYQ